MAELEPDAYEKLLKDDLSCWHCGSEMKNMPTLKAHLQEEWDRQATAEKAKLERKRKFNENYELAATRNPESQLKKQKAATEINETSISDTGHAV